MNKCEAENQPLLELLINYVHAWVNLDPALWVTGRFRTILIRQYYQVIKQQKKNLYIYNINI